MTKQPEQITIHTDGGSRGNPGPSAAGFVLTDSNGHKLLARADFLGETTNNVAEYTGLVNALKAAKKMHAAKVQVLSDSELMVRQINGQYKVKSENLIPLFQQTMQLLAEFESWKVHHVLREKNKEADNLVNQAMDLKKNIEVAAARPKPAKKPVRLGVLISGGGTTLINILKNIKQGLLNAEVALVISSRSDVGGVERAKAAGLDVKVIRKKDYPDIDQLSKRLEEELAAAKVDLVVQGGWLCLWKIPDRYKNLVMNIHPALLPSFGGKGMWGHYVHEAVLKAGCKVSGCTVHFCTNEYDNGPIIVQRCCEVNDGDTPDTLAARVFEEECVAYPQAIQLFAEGRLVVRDNRVIIKK